MGCTLFFLILIVFSNAAAAGSRKSPFSFDDIYDPTFRPQSFNLKWQRGHESFLYRNSSGDVIKYDASEDTRRVFIPSSIFTQLKSDQYYASPDQKYTLFAYEVKQQWRHSFSAKYTILNLETNERYNFPYNELQNESLDFAEWSWEGHSLTFVYKNNLYLQSSPTTPPQQLTFDGNSTVFNGVPNWLYEEEILEDRLSHLWSPDNSFIVFTRIDDSDVRHHYWPYYGNDADVYGQIRSVTYPKAGYSVDGKPGPTSLVKVFVVDVRNNLKVSQLIPPESLADIDHYYLKAAWRDANHVLITWSNRVQTTSISVLYRADNPEDKNEILVTSESNGWVAVPHPNPWFFENGTRYLTVLPYQTSSGSSRQLAAVTCRPGERAGIIFLTRGSEVQAIVGLDESRDYVYYITTYQSKGRQLWRLRLSSSRFLPKCLSCSAEVDYAISTFSSSGENYLLVILGPNVPKFLLKSTAEGKESKSIVLEDNAVLQGRLETKLMPTKRYFEYRNGDGSVGYGQVLIPPLPGKNETFPMLVFTYAGPGTQAVTSAFMLGRTLNNWLVHMASEHRVLIVSTDGRGSMGNGDDLKFSIYKKLATVEIEDQILGANYFKEHSGFKIDDNAAIFGWSYGGFATAHAVANDLDTFMCGVSVAPTTNKGIYDTAYTERYLGLITDPNGKEIYNRTNLVNKVESLKRKKYFIAHGTADDNVHYTHFAHFVRALQEHQVMFRQNSYPDENHAIGTTSVNKHLFRSITEFLLNDCWSQRDSMTFESELEPLRRFFGAVRHFFKEIVNEFNNDSVQQ